MLGVLAVDLFKQTDDYKTAAKADYFLDHRFQKIKNWRWYHCSRTSIQQQKKLNDGKKE